MGCLALCAFMVFSAVTAFLVMNASRPYPNPLASLSNERYANSLLGLPVWLTLIPCRTFEKGSIEHYVFAWPMGIAAPTVSLQLKLTPPVKDRRGGVQPPMPEDGELLKCLQVETGMSDLRRTLSLPCAKHVLKRWWQAGFPLTLTWDQTGLKVRLDKVFGTDFERCVFVAGILILVRELGPVLRDNGAFGTDCVMDFSDDKVLPVKAALPGLGYGECILPEQKAEEGLTFGESDEDLYAGIGVDVPAQASAEEGRQLPEAGRGGLEEKVSPMDEWPMSEEDAAKGEGRALPGRPEDSSWM